MSTKAEQIADYSEKIAADDSHGYSQLHRTGEPDFDCSSLAIKAAEKAGIPVEKYGASYTGNMLNAFVNAGFSVYKYAADIPLRRGDILLNIKNHAAIYVGNGYIVEAAHDENGGITGSLAGDQTGEEIRKCKFYNFPWDYILRFNETVINNPDCSYDDSNAISIIAPQLKYTDYGSAVAAIQAALNYHGFGMLEVNGFFSSTVLNAVKRFQAKHDLEIDGIVGKQTWTELMYWR